MLRLGILLILIIALLPAVVFGSGNNASMKSLQRGFIENQGQLDEEVEFYLHGSRGAVYFTSKAIVFDFKQNEEASAGCVLRIRFEGANADPKVIGRDETPARFNYFRGSNPAEWRPDVPVYREIFYEDVWPGIDLKFRQTDGVLTYEIQSAPGANPEVVEFSYEGADGGSELSSGRVRVETPIGVLTNVRPRMENKTGFINWSPKQKAETGPEGAKDQRDLIWCTYLGGTGADFGRDIARDEAGNLYVVGETKSTDFPTTPGAYDETLQSDGYFDVFVSKLDPSGSNLIYSTYIGGEDHNDYGLAIAVDNAGCGYIIGRSGASFPTTPGAYDQTYNGSQDAFVVKLDSSGSSLVYSTFLGGDSDEHGLGIALDSDCCAYVTGATSSAGFPTTSGVFDSTLNGAFDVFVTKLNSAGSDLEYSTFLGGQYSDFGEDIAIDSGYAFVTGFTNSSLFPTTPGAFDESWNGVSDVFITRVNPTGSDIVYSSFLGGSESDEGYGVTVDGAGCAYVAGNTSSSADFPTTPGAYDTTSSSTDLFMAKLDTWGSTLEYSTLLGGSDYDSGNPVMGLVTDSQGNAYLVGHTTSSDYPTTPGAYDQTLDGNLDICLSKLNSDGSTLLYSTYLGGANDDYGYGVAIDDSGSAFCTGVANGGDFPTTPGAYDEFHNGFEDAFVAKIYTLETGTIAGTISGGRDPIEDAVVTASGPSTDADTTDPGGNYTIGDLSIGTYTVSVTAPGYYPDSQTDVEVTADDTTVVNFFLNRASGAIEGLVSTARGPIENAVVTADGEVTLADTTDPSGYYIIEELPTGFYDVTAVADGYDPRTKPGQEVVPDDTTTVDFNLDLQTGTFEGVVSGLGGLLTGAVVTAEGEYFGSDTTDINGQYLISALPTGNYDIYAYASEHHTGSILGAEIFAGDTTRVDFDLEPFNEHLIWSGFMGGDDDDEAPSLFVDYTGSVFVSGSTWSSNFPVTTGAYDTSLGGSRDAFIAKLNPETAGPFFVTFLGGSSEDGAYDIAVDGAGFPYVTGMTQSSDFPTTAGAYDETYNGDADAFVTKFHAGGNSLVYSTYLGGSGGEEGSSIAVGANGA
jgi:hypothetical protein